MRKRFGDRGREHLIHATLDTLAARGYHRTTLRDIAKTAHVAPQLLRHYFGDKATLMREAYRHHKTTLAQINCFAVAAAGPDPVQRLAAFARVNFDAQADPKKVRSWLSFLEIVNSDPEMRRIKAETYDLIIREIAAIIVQIYAGRGEALDPDAARRLAMGIYAVIDGIWVEMSLDPARITADEGLALALDMIGGRIGVDFSSLSDAPCDGAFAEPEVR